MKYVGRYGGGFGVAVAQQVPSGRDEGQFLCAEIKVKREIISYKNQ